MKQTVHHFSAAALLVLGAAACLVGCQTARMPVPDELSTTERLPVQGRQGWKIREDLRFGPFEVHAIDRSWTRGSDLAVRSLELNERRQQYAFDLREGTVDHGRVTCEANLHRGTIDAELVDVAFVDRSELTCALHAAGNRSRSWTLSLTGKHERPLEGTLTGGDPGWIVRGTRKLQGGLPAETTTGYEVVHMQTQRPAAAVEVLGDGAVWLAETDAEQRGVLAAAAAAVLLFEDLLAHLPRAS